jgi:hypothetical protein
VRSRVRDEISDIYDLDDLVDYMQDNMNVRWNFENLTRVKHGNEEPSGIIEFHGGRCLRGPVRTKRWIAFTIGFIELALTKVSSLF